MKENPTVFRGPIRPWGKELETNLPSVFKPYGKYNKKDTL